MCLPVETETEIEKQLVYEAKNGSDYALARLLQDNYATVCRFMCKLTFDGQLAADVTQDCVERVIEKISLFDPQKSSFSTWMIAIAKNLWIDECRRKKQNQRLCEKYTQSCEAAGDAAVQVEQKDALLSAMNGLDEKQRVPLLLKHGAGYSYDEIAGFLKIPVGTVKSRISNGIKKIKKELESNDR